MQKEKSEKATQASARDGAKSEKREIPSHCAKQEHKWRDIVMVYSWLMDEMRYEAGLQRYLFVCW
jgi:hypothetical protein